MSFIGVKVWAHAATGRATTESATAAKAAARRGIRIIGAE
jgi:hypothetical protein